MDKITITIQISSVISKARQHLALIGKRAKNTQGQSLFSDLTFSTHEEVVFPDLVRNGAETLASQLFPFCGNYDTTNPQVVAFVLTSPNWKTPVSTASADDNDHDLTKALEDAIGSYLFNFALAEYLSIIHPSTGEKYPPLYGSTYTQQCMVILSNIISLCNVRRSTSGTKGYKDVTASVVTAPPSKPDPSLPDVEPLPLV